MKNKEKQIEEMANIIDDCTWVTDENYCESISCEECHAKRLYEQGYRKLDKDSILLSKTDYDLILPPNSVVLSWEEYEALKKQIEYWEHETKVARQDLFEERKETAEKWYNEVKKLYLENVGEQVFEHNWFGVQINKFAKQCGVEIKE